MMTQTQYTQSKWHELKPWLQLFHTKGLSASGFQQLLRHVGEPCAILEKLQSLQELGVSKAIVNAIEKGALCAFVQKAMEQDYQWLLESKNHSIICMNSDNYPELLSNIENPPPILYLKGRAQLLANNSCIAIVGSRSPTQSGIETAQQFAADLAHHNVTVVSGMARGIDGAAHHGVLSMQGNTVAVLGTGINCVYPKAHLALAKDIAEQGLLVSEFPLHTPPRANHFPRRNRIISGLCTATLVIEADIKSGSLITAKIALEQGRDVMAVPGSIYNLRAKGCHELIRQGAALVESIDHILQELQHPIGIQHTKHPLSSSFTSQNIEQRAPNLTIDISYESQHNDNIEKNIASLALSNEALKLLKCIEFDVTHHDVLLQRTGFSSATLAALLCELEWHSLIQAIPGGFIRCSTKSATKSNTALA